MAVITAIGVRPRAALAPADEAIPTKEKIREFVTVMTDETANWEARCAAEDALVLLPPCEVMEALYPHWRKGMPSVPIYNSGGRDWDRNLPVAWQVFYSVSRSWNNAADAFPPDSRKYVIEQLSKFSSSE